MISPVRALIDTRALRHNLERVRESAPQSRVMAVIKADGYGHGMTVVADALHAADAFAVARMDEALCLREHAPEHDICLLSGYHGPEQLALMRQHRVQPVVHCEEQLAVLEKFGGTSVEVWLKIDTGMHRLGFPPAALDSVCRRLEQCNISVHGVMSHFANADEPDDHYNDMQFGRFVAATRDHGLPRSIANSAAVVSRPETRLEWVRPGIMLYGMFAIERPGRESAGAASRHDVCGPGDRGADSAARRARWLRINVAPRPGHTGRHRRLRLRRWLPEACTRWYAGMVGGPARAAGAGCPWTRWRWSWTMT